MHEGLDRAHELASAYLADVAAAPVGPPVDPALLQAALGGPLPEHGSAPAEVIDQLARGAAPGLVGSTGPRYFGFVVGGGVEAAVGADWLASAWDQMSGLYISSPAAAVAELVVAGWLRELLGLPEGAAVGLTTGCQMANFAGLAAARQHVLAGAGWDAKVQGLQGAPKVRVLIGEEAHPTLTLALSYLGLGSGTAERIAVDDQGRMRADALAAALAAGDGGPTIVCAQVGNVNTGAFDPVAEVNEIAHRHGAWVHVDGAFGMWASASPRLAHLAEGIDGCDSWATDAHKYLNVPYDCGVVAVADPSPLETAMTWEAAYIPRDDAGDPYAHVPEASRRARAFPVWAAVRQLGREGIAAMIESCVDRAVEMAELFAAEPGVRVLNEVVLNQVLVRFDADTDQAGDELTRRVVARVQREGVAWFGGTIWQGVTAMRISVSNHRTTSDDARRSVEAVLSALAQERAAHPTAPTHA
jgi:glutamate/tyrosine decarboxylase-like PLP-dependent enzyme